MKTETPLWERLYHSECWIELARIVGYAGITYRDLLEQAKPLRARFDGQAVDSAVHHLVTFEGDRTCNPKPLAHVQLRPEIRKICWQLLGPPPEQWDTFYRHASGEPTPEHAAKIAQLAPANVTEAPKKPRKKK